jgi:hypothetical protein
MNIRVWLARDKSKSPIPVIEGVKHPSKVPAAEMKGVPVRVTTFPGATRTTGAEALVILRRGRVRSVVARAGEMDLYLSPRAEFRCIEPDAPKHEPTEAICLPCTVNDCSHCANIAAEVDEALQLCECAHKYPARRS